MEVIELFVFLARLIGGLFKKLDTSSKSKQKQRAQEVRPIIRFAFESYPQLDRSNLKICNVGLRPARNVKCWMEYQQSDRSLVSLSNGSYQRQLRTPVFKVGGVMKVESIQKWQLDIVPNPTEKRPCRFWAIYQDTDGNYFSSKASYGPTDSQNKDLAVLKFSTSDLSRDDAKNLLKRKEESNSM